MSTRSIEDRAPLEPAGEPSGPSFAELGVSPEVIEALSRRGIREPFEIQAMVLADALAGRDVLGSSRTGSGKTLAFAIPIAERTGSMKQSPAALVLVPTRELACQVTEEFKDVAMARGLRVASVYGGVSLGDQAKRAARAHVLVATPGRLEDLASRRLVALDKIEILILDEADRMLDMGFLPQIQRIVRRLPHNRQTMFFSATLDGDVGRMAASYTRDPVRHSVQSVLETVDEAYHKFIPVPVGGKVAALVELLSADRGSTLIFVRTKRGSARLARRLNAQGIRAAEMHGDMSQGARESALSGFASGKYDALVATDVAARGIDLAGITHVINFDPPEDHKSYIHRVGRTARAGRSGTGITLVMEEERSEVGRIASRLKLTNEFEELGMKVPAPRLAYTSARGRRQGMGRAPKRRV
ncbi:MAG: DEAD/DEAH box helicase [Actinomycetota bacterium]|nr:DEAD/DEAH box helicase [Actinomycetota bacterium]